MEVRVDLREAAAQVCVVLVQYPLRLAAPLVGLQIIVWGEVAGRPWHLNRIAAGVLGFAGGTFAFALTCVAEVLLCAMYLRARAGTPPALQQAREISHYRGLASLCWRLFVRYLGWELTIGAVVLLFALLIYAAGASGSIVRHRAAGVGVGGAHMVGILLEILISGAVMVAILSRYALALPMFAIFEGDRPGLWDESVRLSQSIWNVAALILLASLLPQAVEAAMTHFLHEHAMSAVYVVAAAFVGMLVNGLWSTWFVLWRLEVALQVAPQARIARPATGDLPVGATSSSAGFI